MPCRCVHEHNVHIRLRGEHHKKACISRVKAKKKNTEPREGDGGKKQPVMNDDTMITINV